MIQWMITVSIFTRVWSVVERVRNYQSTTVQAGRQRELDLGNPVVVRLNFRLHLAVILLEIVGEIAIQIVAACIVPFFLCANMKQKSHYDRIIIKICEL